MIDEGRDASGGQPHRDDPEAAAAPTASPFAAAPEAAPPRLGIRHLLLYTACCAAYMGLYRALFLEDDGSAGITAGSTAFAVLYSFSAGAALAACALCVPWNLAGIRFPREPGEWMLILGGASLAILLPVRAVVRALVAESRFDELGFWIVGSLAATCWLYLVPLCLARVSRRWKMVFALFLARDVAVTLSYAVSLMTLSTWGLEADAGRAGFTLAVLVVAAAADLRDRTRRRWTHWAGVWFYVFNASVNAIHLVVLYFARPG